jgi:acetyl-CoA carboxylase biotin carboxyl carrier protein
MTIIDIKTEITGNVWKIVKAVGDALQEEEPILILESMKMEIPVVSPEEGTLVELLTEEESTVTEGSVVARVEV